MQEYSELSLSCKSMTVTSDESILWKKCHCNKIKNHSGLDV